MDRITQRQREKNKAYLAERMRKAREDLGLEDNEKPLRTRGRRPMSRENFLKHMKAYEEKYGHLNFSK